MAAVIHSLWEKGDRSPLILPSTIPIDDPRVQFELTRYLSDNWGPSSKRMWTGRVRCRCGLTRNSPTWANPQAGIRWEALRLTGTDALAVRASKKLRNDELLVMTLGATILRKHLDEVPLWCGDQVPVRQLVEDFARYLYLPRLAGPEVLLQAICSGIGMLIWHSDGFAYAEGCDERKGRYRGLTAGQTKSLAMEDPGLLVKPEVAWKQLEDEKRSQPIATGPGGPGGRIEAGGEGGGAPATGSGLRPGPIAPNPPLPRRFHGTVNLDPKRVGRDVGNIATEVIAHLVGQVGADVTVTLEIEASLPEGASDQITRIVTENSRFLKFTSHGFERE
ncbi:MAG: hypothetical protein BWX80_00168 [Candidatus Hydrogenedentes bacterium ADurb.Bin101]|nr:MAG: hypothetical protein BWX80_00168 [Candidatus Hydrogenedentes bacterium ADurb.Bin101]